MDTSITKLLEKGPSDILISCFKPTLMFCLFFGLIACPFMLFAQEPGEVMDQEAGFYYTVKKGDTLWDLSEQFADSPWLWPDLWEENSQIPNPHWIYPGNRIRLYHKEWTRVMKQPATEKYAPTEDPVYFLYRNIDMLGFIKKDAVKPSAVIFKAKDNVRMLSKGNLVYLRKESADEFIPGSRYTVYRTKDSVKDDTTGKPFGIQHYMSGIVEIIKEEPEFAVGKIVHSLMPINIEDKLMPYTPHSDQIQVVKSTDGIMGSIISSENQQRVFGNHTIAFLDKGTADGIKAGQIYQLFDQIEAKLSPASKEKTLLTPYDIGEVFVLLTQEKTSTVIVTSAKEPLKKDTKVRSVVQ
jgi:hypothetical protein